ncbi:unnamed protein product [Linum trigynum]|uniref:E3 ubiquitin-protein ligase n=1 Tax=Linum trigynum TaxID=586398 RepID=A0AAV2FGC0_9ROSI
MKVIGAVVSRWRVKQKEASNVRDQEEEVEEIVQKSKVGSKKVVSPTMSNRFKECTNWLQWLMFLGDPDVALLNLSRLSSGRGVCGVVWGTNDIAYRCRTCEHGPTCAICVPCFQNGKHEDHDYSIIYTGGGCCDWSGLENGLGACCESLIEGSGRSSSSNGMMVVGIWSCSGSNVQGM